MMIALLLSACGGGEEPSVAEVSAVALKEETFPGMLSGADGEGTSGEGGEEGSRDGEEQTPESASAESGFAGMEEAVSAESGFAGTEEGASAGSGLLSGQEDTISGSGEVGASEPDPDTVKVTISAAGDVTMGNYLGQGYEVSFRQTYDQGVGDSYFFENVADIFGADDLTLVNLEGPLTRSENARTEQTYCISGDPEYVNILTAGNVEVVGLANNHRLDYWEEGTADTVAALEEAGISYAYDDIYCMTQVKGIRIGIVSVNEVGQGAGVEKFLKEGIAQLRGQGADLVLASCHWGIEREYYPEDYQKSLGRKCIDWGADLVIGHHPHVLQGVEEYEGKFILYSLGNFCFGANRNPEDKDCMIFQQTFTFVEGERREDRDIRVIPCSVSSVSTRNDYKPTPAQGQEAGRILERINEYSRDFGVQFDSEGYLTQTDF